MKVIAIFISLFTFSSCYASDSTYTIKINFLYGSRPAKGYHQQELKRFGGIKGGHVNIEAGGRVLDFKPGNNPLLPNNKKPSGGFSINDSIYRDSWSVLLHLYPLERDIHNRITSTQLDLGIIWGGIVDFIHRQKRSFTTSLPKIGRFPIGV